MKIKLDFLRKKNSKKIKCRLLQFLFGALRVNKVYSFMKVFLRQQVFYSCRLDPLYERLVSKQESCFPLYKCRKTMKMCPYNLN